MRISSPGKGDMPGWWRRNRSAAEIELIRKGDEMPATPVNTKEIIIGNAISCEDYALSIWLP
jgi:hypothetical protein